MSDGFVVDASQLSTLGQNAAAAYAALPGEMQRVMTRGVIQADADAKSVVPTDTHNLQRSITHEVTATGDGVVGKVGTNMPYAKPVEFGTGLLSEAPDSKHQRYFPPPSALDRFAIKSGFTTVGQTAAGADVKSSPGTYGYLIALAIYIKGGTKPRPYLRPALAKVKPLLDKEFQQIVPKLLQKLGGG